MQTLLKDQLGKIRCVYLSVLFVYSLIREVIIAQKLVSSPILIYGLFGIGILLILCEFFFGKKELFGNGAFWMALFLVVSLASTLLNSSFGFISNLKAIGWMLLYFYLVYPSGSGNVSRERKWVFSTSVVCASVLALFSLPMYFLHLDYSYSNVNIFGVESNQGFSGEFSRLWGLFGDPNTAALYMSVALLMAGYLFCHCRKAVFRTLLSFSAILMVLYIALSGSRTAFLSLSVTCGWMMFCFIYQKSAKKQLRFLSAMGCGIGVILLCFSVILALRFVLPFTKKGVVTCFDHNKIQAVHSLYDRLYDAGDVAFRSNFDPLQDDWEKTFVSLDRKDVAEKGDLSNGRMDIWADSIRMFLKSPVIGTSPRGAAEFGKVYAPDNLISQKSVACHNFFLEILVGTGILGFALALWILLRAAAGILRSSLGCEFSSETLVFSGIALCLVCGGMFLSDLFFILSFGGASFWYALGALSVPSNCRKDVSQDGKKRILIYGPKDPVGGVEKIVFEYVRTILAHHDDISFDLLQYGADFSMEKDYTDLGCRVLYLPSRKRYFQYKTELDKVFRNTQYAAAWGNYSGLTNIDLLVFAKRYGVPVRIAHSHGSRLYWGSAVMKYVVHLLHYFNKWFRLETFATHVWACSFMAGEFMFPKKLHSQITRIPNAVDTDRLLPDVIGRAKIREELGIPADATVIGHVARMCHVKNQGFLLDVVAEAVKMNPSVRLLFVGDGELREELEEKIKKLNLSQHVFLTGNRSDVPALLSAMDAFVLTSFSEGLSVSAVEAQACGLNCVVPTAVSRETDLTGAVHFLPLERGAQVWANTILNVASQPSREVAIGVTKSGFSLANASERLYRLFLELGE